MTDTQDAINQLLDKLDTLLDRQDDFSKEINNLRIEIDRLKGSVSTPQTQKEDVDEDELVPETRFRVKPQSTSVEPKTYENKGAKKRTKYSFRKVFKLPKFTRDLEKFIGENLINKIGITITVIGVSIGTKYIIDHDIISPLARIILGYLTGLGLLGFGIRLKKNYQNYSAVLVGGAMAIMYFVTVFCL